MIVPSRWFFLTAASVLACPLAVRADLVISEFMASNKKSVTDEDGDHSDWIEIKNTSATAADLTGWSLTDEAVNPRKWLFPAVSIPANSQIVVFASGKDRAAAGQNPHTNFSLAIGGEYLALVRPDSTASTEWAPAFPLQYVDTSYGLSTNVLEETWVRESSSLKAFVPADTALIPQWRGAGFNDTAWTSGTFGVGYVNSGTNPEINVNFGSASATPMSGTGRHSYIRVPFTVADPALVQSLKLRVNYDDGFVAWVNGTRVANSAGAPTSDPISPTALVANHGAAGFEDFVLPAAAVTSLTAGANVLAIEGMNTTVASSDAFLTAQLLAVLTSAGTGETGYFATATPGLPNGGVNSLQLPVSVTPSRASGTFSAPFSLTLAAEEAGQEIRYILADPAGSPGAGIAEPAANSTLYTGPIAISASKLLRAAVFKGGQRGRTLTAEYLLLETAAGSNNTSSFTSILPVMVMDDHGGGQPVDSGSGTFTASMLHLFQPVDGVTRLADAATGSAIADVFSRAGARVRGSSSAGFAKKSYGLETWTEKNEDEDIPLLGMAADSDWILNGPFLFDDTYIHNAYAYEISRRLGRWAPRTRPVELFFNQNGGKLDFSDYAGIYILTEKIKSNSDRLDIASLEPGDTAGEALTGGYIFKIDRADSGEVSWTINNSSFGLGTLPNTESGQSLVIVEPDPDTDAPEQISYLQNTAIKPFNDTLFRERAAGFSTRTYRDLIDSGSFVDHHIVNTIAMNVDALRLSAFYFKDRGAKISAGPVWDFDRALGSDDGRDSNPSSWNSIEYFFDRDWWGGLFRDPQFVQDWVDRWWMLRQPGQPLATDVLRTLADQMGAEIGNVAGARDAARWSDNAAAGGVYLNEITAMKTWMNSRVAFIDGKAPSPPATATAAGTVPAGTAVTITGAGTIRYTLDGTDPRPFGGATPGTNTAYTGPVAINSTTVLTARRQSSFTPFPSGAASISWSAPLRRVLLVDEFFAAAGDLSIAALNYHPFPPTAAELAAVPGIEDTDFEWLEIKNTGARAVNLIDMVLPAGAPFDSDFKFGLKSLAAGKSLLLVKNRAAFEVRYGTGASGLIAGEWVKGNLKDSGEAIRLLDRTGAAVIDFSYSDTDGWPVAADGKGAALEYKGTAFTSADLALPANWQASAAINGTPGGDPAATAAPAVGFNEALAESAPPFVDGVELRNASAAPVDISGWFLTDAVEYSSLEPVEKFRIPAGTVLAPGGYAVFTETGFNPNGPWNPAASPAGPGPQDFSLDGVHGGKLRLISRDAGGGLRVAGELAYGPMRVNESTGPRADGGGQWDPLNQQTLFDTVSAVRPYPGLGAVNSGVRSGPVIVREIRSTAAGGGGDLAFIELLNPTADAVPLDRWKLRGSVSRDFTAADTLAPGGLLVLLPFAPSEEAKLAAFRQFYKIDASVTVSGPWTAAVPLAGGGDIQLIRAGAAPAAEPAYHPLTREDRAAWRSGSDGWPDTAATGFSLNRKVPAEDGSTAAAWIAQAATPGDFSSPPPLSYATWKASHFPAGDPATPDPDGDGIENLLEYAFDTHPLTPENAASILPVMTMQSGENGASDLLYTYTRPVSRPGVVWTIEKSTDLAEWMEVTDTAAGAAGEKEIRRAAIPTGPGLRIFLRLHVTITP
ncbi:MAG: lamin tail domain-containing protein [Verrucomicrobiota bacterium]